MEKNEWTPVTWESLAAIAAFFFLVLVAYGSVTYWLGRINPTVPPIQQMAITCLNGTSGTINGTAVSESQIETGCGSSWPSLHEHLKKVCPDGWSVNLNATSSPDIVCDEYIPMSYITVRD